MSISNNISIVEDRDGEWGWQERWAGGNGCGRGVNWLGVGDGNGGWRERVLNHFLTDEAVMTAPPFSRSSTKRLPNLRGEMSPRRKLLFLPSTAERKTKQTQETNR